MSVCKLCVSVGNIDAYQSVLNGLVRSRSSFQAVNNDHIQLLHDGKNHWLLTFCAEGQVYVCDSMGGKVSRVCRKSVSALYRCFTDKFGKIRLSYLGVQKQSDGYNCGLFAIAFAAEVLHGQSPVGASFIVEEMRPHLINCLETEELTAFPKSC